MKFTVDFPIIGWGSVEVETDDYDDPLDLEQAIENDEFDLKVGIVDIKNWAPMKTYGELKPDDVEAPFYLTVS